MSHLACCDKAFVNQLLTSLHSSIRMPGKGMPLVGAKFAVPSLFAFHDAQSHAFEPGRSALGSDRAQDNAIRVDAT